MKSFWFFPMLFFDVYDEMARKFNKTKTNSNEGMLFFDGIGMCYVYSLYSAAYIQPVSSVFFSYKSANSIFSRLFLA